MAMELLRTPWRFTLLAEGLVSQWPDAVVGPQTRVALEKGKPIRAQQSIAPKKAVAVGTLYSLTNGARVLRRNIGRRQCLPRSCCRRLL